MMGGCGMKNRPVLIYDGECRFCRRWIERWRVMTGDRVDYQASQDLVGKYAEISPEEFALAVQWVGANGERLSGAEAVLAALATNTWLGRTLLAWYRTIPVFALLANAAYGFVARHRGFFSKLTWLLWGNDVRPPTYATSTFWFLRSIGAIYFIAFGSFWWQVPGLLGERGIAPAPFFFQRAGEILGPEGFWQLPSLCWWASSEVALNAWSIGGMIVSVALICGYAPMACLVFLWAVYLSLTIAGQVFYQFQWDILLLEAGFLAIFVAPFSWRLRQARPSEVAHFLLLWLLFRLMFASGVVKLTSGDPSWADGSALSFHYFTQPLPTPLAWFAQQLPAGWQWLSVKVMFFIELVLPFFLFAPRRLRLLAVGGLVLLQVLIALTGNYGFFNLLTLALCLLAVDDAVWRHRLIAKARAVPRGILWPAGAVLFALSLVPLAGAFRRPLPLPPILVETYEAIAPFRTVNGYGLFAVMTKDRPEIIVQGSEDGLVWKTYAFRYKPGDVRRAPPWVAPYMPRLDWQMWFAALGNVNGNPWFMTFMQRLLEGSPEVLALLAENPFPHKPPRFVRALTDDYTFTTSLAEKDWWKAEPVGVYCGELSLR